jgi:5'-deoxynucleotidase YfbR-like HD superfamily hydrolase/nucleoside phosphorylase
MFENADLSSRIYTCAVIIALDEEFRGADDFPAFDSFFEPKAHLHGPASAEFTFFDASATEHRGVVAILPNMGRLPAYSTTLEVLKKYNPSLAVNIGIGGGLSKDVRKGDVVIANQVDDVGNRKKIVDRQTGQGPQILLSPIAYEASPVIITKAEDLRVRPPDLYASWQRACSERVELAAAKTGQSEPQKLPELHIGKLACDDAVIDSVEYKASLLQGNRNLLCCDMESAGFLKACQAQMTPFTAVIKAISDDADGTKLLSDAVGKGFWRRCAMSNAYSLLAVLLRTLSFATAREGVKIDMGTSPEDALLEIARQRFFKKQHANIPSTFEELRPAYSRLFSHFLENDLIKRGGDVFDATCKILEDSPEEEPIQLVGEPGIGKTTFLSFLYLALHEKFRNSPNDSPIPIYINLKEYLYPPISITRPALWDPMIQWQQDHVLMATALGASTAANAVFVVDGVDEYSPVLERIERDVIGLLDQWKRPKKLLIGFGKNYLGDNPFFKREFPYLRPPRIHLRMRPVRLSSTTATSLVQSFIGILPTSSPHDTADDYVKQAHKFRFALLDMQTLSMLHDSLREPRYSECKSVVDFLSVLCRNVLHKYRSDAQETLDSGAQLAFTYALNPASVDLVTATKLRAWKLMHVHPAVNDFLIAYYATRRLKQAATARDESDLQDLDFVFPYRVNRFCKELANASVDDQMTLLEGAKKVYKFGQPGAKPHGCYVVGRLADPSAQKEASIWLRNCEHDLNTLRASKNESLTTSELLLARTIYISLAYLGNRRASDAYLELIMRYESWNRINRGFHLEYYGDIPFSPVKQLSHADDNRTPFTFTYEILAERLRMHADDLEYGLFEIEVFTLFSLAQVRHANDALPSEIREQLLILTSRLLNAGKRLGKPIRDYLMMIKKHLGQPSFRIGDVGRELYSLKKRERVGWKKRNIRVRRIESVADHTWGAHLLGMLYLPDWIEGEETYSKQIVLKMLMVHDLAEALTGDVALHDQTEQTRQAEADAFKYIEMCGTYDRIADLKQWYSLWREFEVGETINARIAHDMDKLDNLMQLNVYGQEATIDGAQEWRSDLLGSLLTDVGRDIAEIVKAAFRSRSGKEG